MMGCHRFGMVVVARIERGLAEVFWLEILGRRINPFLRCTSRVPHAGIERMWRQIMRLLGQFHLPHETHTTS